MLRICDRLALCPLLLLIALHGCSAPPASSPPPQSPAPLTPARLNQLTVTGSLGLPLGTAAEVTAVVVSGRETRMKMDDGQYLLRVTAVDGRTLAKPVLMHFSSSGLSPVRVAPNEWALYELKHGEKATQLDSASVAKLEEGFVGSVHNLIVYETGGFSGLPDVPPRLAEEVPLGAGYGFGFMTELVVVKERP